MSDLLDDVYEAALDPSRWSRLLGRVSQQVGAVGGLLIAERTDGVDWIGSPSMRALMEAFVEEGWHLRNERAARLASLRTSRFVTDGEAFTQREIENSKQYSKFLRPRGMGFGAGTIIAGAADDNIILTMEGFQDAASSLDACLQLDALRPHLARAALTASRLRLEHARAGVTALQMIGVPGALLSRDGVVIAANDLMNGLIPTLVEDRRRRLSLTDPRADIVFEATLARLRAGATAGCSILLKTPVFDKPAVAHLLPVRGSARDVFSGISAMLVISISGRRLPTGELLQRLFDLTVAEAQLAALLAEGFTLAAAAQRQGISRNTAKTHLRSIFAKLGVRRQVELVTWLNQCCALVEHVEL